MLCVFGEDFSLRFVCAEWVSQDAVEFLHRAQCQKLLLTQADEDTESTEHLLGVIMLFSQKFYQTKDVSVYYFHGIVK